VLSDVDPRAAQLGKPLRGEKDLLCAKKPRSRTGSSPAVKKDLNGSSTSTGVSQQHYIEGNGRRPKCFRQRILHGLKPFTRHIGIRLGRANRIPSAHSDPLQFKEPFSSEGYQINKPHFLPMNHHGRTVLCAAGRKLTSAGRPRGKRAPGCRVR